MDGVEVKTHPRIRARICSFKTLSQAIEAGPARIFEQPSFLVLEHLELPESTREAFLRHLSFHPRPNFSHGFYEGEGGPDLDEAMAQTTRITDNIFKALFPAYQVERVASSYRNRRSGPEPMHYDSYDPEGYNVVCAFLNVGREPRKYRVSYDFGQLVEENPDIRDLAKKCKNNDRNVSVELRGRWLNRRGPGKVWEEYHEASFPPYSIWFFSPKTIAHQLMSGYGVFGMSWHVKGCDLKSQEEFLEK